MTADMIYDQKLKFGNKPEIINPGDVTQRKSLDLKKMHWEDLLIPIFRRGKKVYQIPAISKIKEMAIIDMARMDDSIKRFENPHTYPVGLEKTLFDKKMELILRLRNIT